MELRVFVEPQVGASYEVLLASARVSEESGFGAWFRSDHFLAFPGLENSPLPGSTDAWTTLAGLARETSRIRLGTLLSAATFRLPGPLAITVAQVDAMSAGRVELGLGAGWYEEEHTAYGIPFPPTAGERLDRLEEQLEIITGLWTTPVDERYGFEGRHYHLARSPGLPKPVQHPRPPVIVGGGGTRRTPAIAVRFADELNVPFRPREAARPVFEAADRACEAAGRDPADLVRSVALKTCIGADPTELDRRRRRIGPFVEGDDDAAVGLPGEVAERLARWAELGVTRVYLQFLDLNDLDHVRLAGEALAPLVAGL